MTISRQERVSQLLEKAADIYAQFLAIVQDEIITPLAKGNSDKCRSNLKKFGKKVSITEIILIVIRGANLLTFSMLKSGAISEQKPLLSESYIESRLEHFKDRIADMKRKGTWRRSYI